MTLTLIKQLFAKPNTLASVGSLVVPHVLTSGGAPSAAVVTRVSTNVNVSGEAQRVVVVAGKFTFSVMFVGRIGRALDARSAWAKLRLSAA